MCVLQLAGVSRGEGFTRGGWTSEYHHGGRCLEWEGCARIGGGMWLWEEEGREEVEGEEEGEGVLLTGDAW